MWVAGEHRRGLPRAPSLAWTVQLAAVVGGHIVGAWAGHIVADREAPHRTDVRLPRIPLAVLMVALTATALWSLGQTIVKEPTEAVLVVARGDGAVRTFAERSSDAEVPEPGAC